MAGTRCPWAGTRPSWTDTSSWSCCTHAGPCWARWALWFQRPCRWAAAVGGARPLSPPAAEAGAACCRPVCAWPLLPRRRPPGQPASRPRRPRAACCCAGCRRRHLLGGPLVERGLRQAQHRRGVGLPRHPGAARCGRPGRGHHRLLPGTHAPCTTWPRQAGPGPHGLCPASLHGWAAQEGPGPAGAVLRERRA